MLDKEKFQGGLKRWENMKLNNNLECPMLGLGTFMLSTRGMPTQVIIRRH